MKDIKPLLLLLLSIGLVGTWAYHLYDKTIYSQRRTEIFVKDSAAVADAIRDSLTKIYSNTIQDLDTRLSSSGDSLVSTKTRADSLQRSLQSKVKEINRLKSEISGILNKGGKASREDMETARLKIEELQSKVGELSQQNLSMEEEKKQLGATLAQLSQNADKLEQNIRRLSDENASLNEKIGQASLFFASDVAISAVEVKNSGEKITSLAKKAEKFIISFNLQNNVNNYTNAEVIILIIQPDKQVLQNFNWDSGVFDTQTEGKKNFTRKVKFDYTRAEKKELTFTLDTDEFQKGTYQLQVWHKGALIGKAFTSLN